nr:MAG TPA: hypothetical protein [Caudoviricetes sp.]
MEKLLIRKLLVLRLFKDLCGECRDLSFLNVVMAV